MAGWTFNRPAKSKRAPVGARAPVAAPMSAMAGPWPQAQLTLDALVAVPQAQLARVVELEIIPRLMLLHRGPLPAPPPDAAVRITDAHVQALAELAVEGTPEATLAFVRGLLAEGASHEQLFLDLLTPCARWMGALWESDDYSFSQVTIGLWRLQRVLHELAEPMGATGRAQGDGRRVLLAAVPGSQHTFGVSMLAEFFMRGGWDVACEPRVSWAELKRQAASRWCDVLGLSISASDSVTEVASAILDIRRAAANPQLFVMVGGPMASQMPDLARRCGADAMASDAPTALATANASLGRGVKIA